MLSNACNVNFDRIWTRLPSEILRGTRIAELCRKSCGQCFPASVLLDREVLTLANTRGGDFEVQRLHFALPQGLQAAGPSAHVKVRAPDSQGQRNRVRAYSMLIDRRGFNLTVKIYPGGPPHSRGTSAHLGSLPVGQSIEVPQVRALAWAIAPERARRIGLIAFGVGVYECLEPIEMLLAHGHAHVRLVYASRSEAAILYRDLLRRMLREYPTRFSVRHCLSQQQQQQHLHLQDGAEAEPAAGGAAAGEERVTSGRIDGSIVRAEFGAWAASGEGASGKGEGIGADDDGAPHFVVVGTGRMEHAAWSWLEELGLRRRLLRGTAWRPWQQLSDASSTAASTASCTQSAGQGV